MNNSIWAFIVSTVAGALIGFHYARVSEIHNRVKRIEAGLAAALALLALKDNKEEFPEEVEE